MPMRDCSQVTAHCKWPILLLLVCICSIHLERNEANSVISQCLTSLFLQKFIFWATLQSLVADSRRIQNQVVFISLLNCVHPLFQSFAFVLPGIVCILYIFSLSKPEHQHCCFRHLDIPRKATLNFCQVKNASNNQVSKNVSSGEW